jgi:hypothetical protein
VSDAENRSLFLNLAYPETVMLGHPAKHHLTAKSGLFECVAMLPGAGEELEMRIYRSVPDSVGSFDFSSLPSESPTRMLHAN